MPADVVCVIDVSGSMGSAATFEGPDGSQINPQGLTLMDITKYACRAVAHMLQPGDRLGLVTFNTAGVIKTKLTEMTDAGKAKVSGDIEKVHFSAAVYCCRALLPCIAAVHCCCALLPHPPTPRSSSVWRSVAVNSSGLVLVAVAARRRDQHLGWPLEGDGGASGGGRGGRRRAAADHAAADGRSVGHPAAGGRGIRDEELQRR